MSAEVFRPLYILGYEWPKPPLFFFMKYTFSPDYHVFNFLFLRWLFLFDYNISRMPEPISPWLVLPN